MCSIPLNQNLPQDGGGWQLGLFKLECTGQLPHPTYEFRGQARVSIYLYSSNTSINSLTKLGHQVDAELGPFSCAVPDVKKSIRTLKDMNVKLEGVSTLISDSNTCLSLCLCPSIMLDLSRSLIVSWVQEVFSNSNLYFVPGKTFKQGVDLLLRYRPRLLMLITNKIYSPSWLKPENKKKDYCRGDRDEKN